MYVAGTYKRSCASALVESRYYNEIWEIEPFLSFIGRITEIAAIGFMLDLYLDNQGCILELFLASKSMNTKNVSTIYNFADDEIS